MQQELIAKNWRELIRPRRLDIEEEEQTKLTYARFSCEPLERGFGQTLGNSLRRLALPGKISHWSLTTLREKLVKIGAKVVKHSRYVIFQMAEVLVSKRLFEEILERIHQLKPAGIGYG